MSKSLARLILFASSVLGFLVPMSRAQSWSNGYAFRRPITIDHTKVSNTDQTNFPVLISGTYAYLATTSNGGDVASSNGYDITFTSDAAGTIPLPFERESYSASTGAVCFWVQVPTLSHTTDTVIYMFYGNGFISADPSNKTAVWSANYVGVWHLPNGTTLSAKDSTSQANNGTITGATANSGKIAGGASLSGSTQYIDVGNNSSLQITGSALSIEAWLNTSESNPGQYKRVVAKEFANNANPWVAYSLNRVANTNQMSFSVSHGGSGTNVGVTSVSSLPMGTWTHVVGTYDGSYLRLYINGSQDAQAATSGSIVNTNQDVVIGADTAASTEYFNGTLDEVRISTSGRSADWIAAEYRNESSPSTFYSVGSATINGLNGSSAPYVAGLSPASGAPTSSVTVLGANFGATQGTSTVAFNGTLAGTASSWSDSSIVATVPASAATGNMVIHAGGVDSNGINFTVTGPPSISSLSVTTGAPGAAVTITGSNFGSLQASGMVTFNGAPAAITSWSASSIVAVVPSAATSGNVVVNCGDVNSNGISFTVVPAPTITGISPTSASIGAPVSISGSNFGSSQGTGVVKLNGITCSVLIWGPSSITVSVPTGASSGAFSVTASGVTVNSPAFTVSTALPQGWSDQEVGPNTPGSATYANNVFTMQSKGGDYCSGSSTADNFHFAYQTLTGDGTIIARVVSISNGYGEAGVMMRDTLDPGAKRVATAICTGDENFLYRATIGGTSSYVGVPYPGANAPYWSKLTRSGNTFTGYISSDGVNWVRLGTSQSIGMAQTIFIGLAVAGGSSGSPYTYTFDNVSVSSASNPAPLITSVSATTAPVGAQVVITGQNFGATQGSSAVLLHGTATTINSWSATSISITIPTGATSGYLVVSVAPTMNNSNPVNFIVETNALPQTWLDQDVGVVHFAGNASYSSGVFSVYSGGNTADAVDGYHFVYQTLTGDGTIIARVANTGYSYAMAGVMMTASLNANDQNVYLCEYAGGTRTFYRSVFGTANQVASSGGGLPYWVKLVRTGNNFIGYISPDNAGWTLVAGPIPIAMPNTIYVGLASTSNNGGQAYTSTYDNVSIATATNPAPVITSVSATTASVGTQVIITGSGFGSAQGNGIATLNQISAPVGFWSDTSVMVTIPSGATSGYLNVLRGPDMQSSNGVYFTVESQPLIPGWLDLDIGNVGTRGSASFSGGVFTVQGSGSSVGGDPSDALHFVYQPFSTDGTITARIVTTSANAHPAVMIRQSLSSNSTNAAIYMFPYGNPSVAVNFNYRTLTGGPTSTASAGLGSLGWVRLTRNTNTYTALYSPDGVSWTQVGVTQTIPSPQTVYVGLAVTGPYWANTATFDNVSITAGSSLPNPVINSIAPLSGAPGTLVTISGSGFGTTQSNSTVMFNGAPSTSIYSWSNTQIQAVVPDQATNGPISVVVNNITGQGPTFTVAFSVTLTDSLGNTTSYTSSPFGGQWSFTDAQGSGCSSCTTRGTVHRQYDGQGNIAWSIDALGHGTVYRYDSSNNTTSQAVQGDATIPTATTIYTYNSFGEPLTVTDPLGNVTTNAYDGHGNLTSVTQPRPNGSTNASVTQFGYNTLGQLVTITDPRNNVTTLTYTPVGLIYTITDMQSHVTTYGYDTHGNRTSVLDAVNNLTTFAYDTMDRLTTITYPDRTSTTTFGYDSRGRRTSVTDQNGKTTTYAYDDADRLLSVTDASTSPHVTMYGYDTENNLTSITDANQNQTIFEYDQFGRVKKTNFPSSNVETYGYDANNNLITKTDRKGQTIQYVYDVLNRLSRKQYQDSTEVDYVYDLVGKIQQVTDPTGTYAFAYDNMGRLIGTTTNYNFLPSKTFSTSYTYDAASNRTGFTDPEQGSTTYAYDTLNRLQTLTPPVAISSGSFGFGYDAVSRRTSLTRPNNVTTTYGYDNLSHLQSVLHQLAGSTIDGASYATDPAGNRTLKTDQRTAVTTNYGYDNIYQLLSTTPSGGAAESYTYDPVGNRLSSLGAASYSYNSSNELTSTSTATYGYDLNGNAVTKTDSTGITTYAWDFENRLTSVTLPGSGGTVSFKYDPFGRRIYKSSSSGTSVFAYDGDNLIEETNSSGTAIARYSQTQNIDEPLAMFRSGVTSYYQADGVSSVTSLSNSAGSLVQTYGYDSFGKQTSSAGSLTNPFQYTAREFDAETALYYYRARYYDPAVGRFLSEDTIGFNSDDLNLYRYVKNSPIGSADPTGNRKYDCGAKCWFRLERDPFKGHHINWKCNGLQGCLLWPSLQICERNKSDLPPNRLRECIDDNLNKPKPKSCPKTDFEYKKEEESNRYMEKFWDWILVGDAALAVVGTAGALGWLGGAGAGAGGAAAPKPPIDFPRPAPPPPIQLKPAA